MGRALIVLVAFGLAACGPATSGAASPSSSSSIPQSLPSSLPAPTFAPTPTPQPKTGPVGTTFAASDLSGNLYDVTLTGVVDPAGAVDLFPPVAGAHFVVLDFKMVGVSGIVSDGLTTAQANVTGGDGKSYQTATVAQGCTVVNGVDPNSFSTTPGSTATPCAVFQVLDGVRIATVTWSLGFINEATWTVNG